MSSGELLVIAIVALLVFGPGKLPMLARHLGLLVRRFHGIRAQAQRFWQEQWQEQQLLENQRKAEEAEARQSMTSTDADKAL